MKNRKATGVNPTLSRRRALQVGAGVMGAAAASTLPAPAILAASRKIKIGHVSPRTGPLAPFAVADTFAIGVVRNKYKNGLKIGNTTYQVEIISKDSQSNPNRAAEVAADLILKDKVNIMCVGNTPETTNPVGDQAEANDVPCISSLAPWQPWFFTRGGKPGKGFKWTYHFFWGLEDIIATYMNMWDSLDTNKQVGGLFPNDGDGNAWGDKKRGLPPALAKRGYIVHDPGRYQDLTDDFSAQIAAFKKAKCDIVTGVVIPPDFTTFWKQARQQGFRPKAATVGKALLFPSSVEALGKDGHNLSSEVWWTPNHPFRSSMTGQTCAQLAQAFEAKTGRQWSQPIGFAHALFEVVFDVLKRTKDVGSNEAILAAIVKTKMNTIVGPVDWTKGGPFKNVSKTPLVGGQWRYVDKKFKYELVIVNNKAAPHIPVGGKMEPLA
jgi:branched-chain amino acid transport system substrate-binding protein